MALSVNGELIPDALVAQEFERLLKTQKLGNPDPAQVRLMAACAVIDRVLIRQAAGRDPRPVDPQEIETVMRREMQAAGCRTGVNEPTMRRIAEQQLRIQRVTDELAAGFARPTPEKVLARQWRYRRHRNRPSRSTAARIPVPSTPRTDLPNIHEIFGTIPNKMS